MILGNVVLDALRQQHILFALAVSIGHPHSSFIALYRIISIGTLNEYAILALMPSPAPNCDTVSGGRGYRGGGV
jgi:hypothetical protein